MGAGINIVNYKNEFYLFLHYFAAGFMLYSGLSFCYFGLVNLGISLRVRLLDIVASHPQGISRQELLKTFDQQHLLGKRLSRLVAANQVVLKKGYYCMAEGGLLRLAKINSFIKKLYNVPN